jgi:hypothetical protein
MWKRQDLLYCSASSDVAYRSCYMGFIPFPEYDRPIATFILIIKIHHP